MRYFTYSQYLKNKYGERVYKLPINLPGTCPNRDGTSGYGGCIYCGEAGAAFENLSCDMPVKEQIKTNMEYIGKKYKAEKFIAYFQNYSNTYMPLDEFKKHIEDAVMENVVEIAVSTRPDCICDEYLDFLKSISEKHKIEISIELGLQSVNYHTLKTINRGHTLAEFLDAVLRIKRYAFSICGNFGNAAHARFSRVVSSSFGLENDTFSPALSMTSRREGSFLPIFSRLSIIFSLTVRRSVNGFTIILLHSP